jgi:hypothetical protein
MFVTSSGVKVPLLVDKVLLGHLMPPESNFLIDEQVAPFVSALVTKIVGLRMPMVSSLCDVQTDHVANTVMLAVEIIKLKNNERSRLLCGKPGGVSAPMRM